MSQNTVNTPILINKIPKNLINIKTIKQHHEMLMDKSLDKSLIVTYYYKSSLTYGCETLPIVRTLAEIYPTTPFVVIDLDIQDLSDVFNNFNIFGFPLFMLYNAGPTREIYSGWKKIEKVEGEIRSFQFHLQNPVIPDADDLRKLKDMSEKFNEESEMNVSEGSIDSRFLSSDSEAEGIDFD